MKKNFLIAMLFTVLIPAILFSFIHKRDNSRGEFNNPQGIMSEHENQTDTMKNVEIDVLSSDSNKRMLLEDYILGVVLGEMPADFHNQSLMAQAVVSRTYAHKSMKQSKHKGADVCTNASCCQAYMDPDDYLSSGGSVSSLKKVRQAVEETEGLVLIYEGELIEATYFSCSGGRTEPAYAVWGSDVPYLQSVESPGEESASHYTDTVTFSIEEFCEKMGIEVLSSTDKLIDFVSYTEGGGISQIVLNGQSFSGTEVRKRLDLRSTAFVVSVVGNTVSVTTKGFGHRVGMSQYGAEAMAAQGRDYQEILQHYYPGTELIVHTVDKIL